MDFLTFFLALLLPAGVAHAATVTWCFRSPYRARFQQCSPPRTTLLIPSDAPPGDGAEVVAREAGPAIICERLPRPEWMERRA